MPVRNFDSAVCPFPRFQLHPFSASILDWVRIYSMMPFRFFVLSLLVIFSTGCTRSARPKDNISIFVAASLVDVADSLSQLFQSAHPDKRIRFNVGATSTLARQIEFGASADYFLSADSLWSEYIVAGIPLSRSHRLPATNTLVVFSTARSFNTIMELTSIARLAVGDPSHVPAGRYAKAALECLGLWETLSRRIIPTSDVRAALAAATTGSVDAAIVYATDADVVKRVDRFILPIPTECQPSITIDLVALPGSQEESWREGFGSLMLSEGNRGVWEAFGFVPIGGMR